MSAGTQRFFVELIALPMRVIAGAMSIARVGDPRVLHNLLWRLSGTAADAAAYLRHIYAQDTIRGREEACRLLATTDDARVFAEVANLERYYGNDLAVLRQWRELAPPAGSRAPYLLYLDMLATDRRDELLTAAAEVLEHRDLPAYITEYALFVSAWYAVQDQAWQTAGRTVARVLSIREARQFRVLNLAIAIGSGSADVTRQAELLRSDNRNDDTVSEAYAYALAGDQQGAARVLQRCSLDYLRAHTVPAALQPIAASLTARSEQDGRDA